MPMYHYISLKYSKNRRSDTTLLFIFGYERHYSAIWSCSVTAQYLGKSIQNISGVGHFEFSTEHPGTVRLRLMKDSSAVEVDLRQSVSISPSVAIDIDMARFPLTTVPLCEVKLMEGFGYHLTTKGKGWNISGVRLWFCKPSL